MKLYKQTNETRIEFYSIYYFYERKSIYFGFIPIWNTIKYDWDLERLEKYKTEYENSNF